MKYAYTILYVADVSATVAFYEAAFGFKPKFITPETDYAELESGATTIAFASLDLGNANFKAGFQQVDSKGKPFGIELAFTSEEVEADFERALKAGAQLLEPLVTKPWGQKVGYCLDNNGFLIELCSPMHAD